MNYELVGSWMDSLSIALCVFDNEDRAVAWNRGFTTFFPEHANKVSVGEPYEINLRRFYQTRLSEEDLPNIDRFISDGLNRHRTQNRPYVFSHRGRTMRVTSIPMPNGDRARIWVDLAGATVDQRVDGCFEGAENIEPSQSNSMAILLNKFGEGVAVLDKSGRLISLNERMLALYGLERESDALGKTLKEFFSWLWETTGTPTERMAVSADVSAAMQDSLLFIGVPFDVPLPGARWVRVTVGALSDNVSYTLHSEISHEKIFAGELRAVNTRLKQEAHHDALTGLQNRRGLDGLVNSLSFQPGTHSLLFVDLDGFKSINDSAGHAAGDEVLRQVSSCLKQCVRAGDAIVRYGGDEFVIILRSCDASHARVVAQKIINCIKDFEFRHSTQMFNVGASIGVRVFSGHAEEPSVLIHDADSACYLAKTKGKGRVVFFNSVPDSNLGVQEATP